jgi:hypothetical protein
MNDLIIPTISAIIGVGGTLLTIWYKHRLVSKRLEEQHVCPIEKCVSEDELVLGKLKDVLQEVHGDRLSIFSFHNGGTYYSGKSMQKMSMSYEECDNGISSTMMNKQNIPVSACITTLKPLMENGLCMWADTKDHPEGLCKHHLKVDGVKSTYSWSIIDIHSNIIGVLRLDYVKRKTTLSDNDQEKLKLLATQLPGYLYISKLK